MGGKFLPDPLGIHIVKVFWDNGLTHVTKEAFVEDTIYKVIFNLNSSRLSASPLGLKVGCRISSQSWALAVSNTDLLKDS